MNTKIISGVFATLFLSIGSISMASSLGIGKSQVLSLLDKNGILVGESNNTNSKIEIKDNEADASLEAKLYIKKNATSTEKNNKEKDDAVSNDQNKSTTTKDHFDNDSSNALDHRSKVSIFVKGLLSVADREGGIGEQVRVIAREQNESASTTAHTMVNIENRSGFKTFFIGSDFKNLGELCSEYVKTENQIKVLQKEQVKWKHL